MRRFVVAICCLTPVLILASEEECKLGAPWAAGLSTFEDGKYTRRKQIQSSQGANKESGQLPPIDPKILEYSSQALDFLKNCNYGFVENYVRDNHRKPTKMNPILKTLNMHSPNDWEHLAEGTVRNDLNNEETKEDLKSCIRKCNIADHKENLFGDSYEDKLEDFQQNKAGSKKPDYTCPKCVQYLPANLLVTVPDVLWEIKSKPKKTTTTQLTKKTVSTTTPSTPTLETTKAATTQRPTTVTPTTASGAVTSTGDSRKAL